MSGLSGTGICLHCYHSPEPLLSLFPYSLRHVHANYVVHYDPHLGNGHDGTSGDFSYGDVPLVNPRASALKKARPGDWLLFIANLVQYNVALHSFAA